MESVTESYALRGITKFVTTEGVAVLAGFVILGPPNSVGYLSISTSSIDIS